MKETTYALLDVSKPVAVREIPISRRRSANPS